MNVGLWIAIGGAALAAFLAGIGSSIGVGLAGRASAGVMSEQPERFGSLLLLTALPGTQGIYGFVIAIIMLIKLGLLRGEIPVLSIHQGISFLMASLPVAFAGLLSAIHQGKVCASGVYMVAKQPKEFGKAMVLAVFVEFYAVLGFLTSFLILTGLKV